MLLTTPIAPADIISFLFNTVKKDVKVRRYTAVTEGITVNISNGKFLENTEILYVVIKNLMFTCVIIVSIV